MRMVAGAIWQKWAKRRGKWVCSGPLVVCSAMKAYSICLLLLALAGCRDKPAVEAHDAFWASTRPDSVVLKNGLGTVYLRVPRAYDTLLVWLRYSDCTGCGDYRFRFQPKKLPMHKEHGWAYAYRLLRDSVNQLTIQQPEDTQQRADSTNDNSTIQRRHRQNLAAFYTKRYPPDHPRPLAPPDFDSLERINSRYFSIIASTQTDATGTTIQRIIDAETGVGSNLIKFTYELRTRQNDSLSHHFQRDALRMLRTVRIRPSR